MNRFKDANTVEEVVGQAIGAGSLCWLPSTGDLEFDSAAAEEIGDAAVERIRELGLFQ